MQVYEVFGKKQIMVSYSIQELLDMYTGNRIILKHKNQEHIRKIKNYITNNLLDEQIYFSPIVANIAEWEVVKPRELMIIDGSQRLYALIQLQQVMIQGIRSDDSLKMKIGYRLLTALNDLSIGFQIFEGLTPEVCNQMYIDLNTKGKKVSLSKRISFDSRNSINQVTNYILNNHLKLQMAGVEKEKVAVMRPKNKNLLSLSQLRSIVAIFFSGKIKEPRSIQLKDNSLIETSEYIDLIYTWFDELFSLYPAERIGNFEECMLANFPLLQAVALYAVNELEERPFEERKLAIIDRMRKLQQVNWNRNNPVWERFNGTKKGRKKYFFLSNEKKNMEQIIEWLKKQGR